jgi:NAD(P)-dependent dehydrogenase (short-subunit alcohol dehydrogenase family)
MRQLDGTTAVVIGGTHGMGMATVKALLERGASVLLTGRSERNVDRARAELGDRAQVIRSDVADLGDVEALAGSVRAAFASVDAVFLFAAVAEFEPFDQVSEASFDRQFAVNTRGAFFTVQRLAPLVKDGGSITLTTVTPATASPSMSVYMGSKAAVRAFAQVFAAELLPRRVRVNTLAPGFIDTPTLGVAGFSPEARGELRSLGDQVTPMKRHGTVDEIARAALSMSRSSVPEKRASNRA